MRRSRSWSNVGKRVQPREDWHKAGCKRGGGAEMYQVPAGYQSQRIALGQLVEARRVALLPCLAKSPTNDHGLQRGQPRTGSQARRHRASLSCPVGAASPDAGWGIEPVRSDCSRAVDAAQAALALEGSHIL